MHPVFRLERHNTGSVLFSSNCGSAEVPVTINISGPCEVESALLVPASLYKGLTVGNNLGDESVQVKDNCGNSLSFEVKNIEYGDLEYIYRGVFTQSITENILSLTETNLDKVEETSKIKGRIFFIMTEGLQNITRHQDLADDSPEKTGIFVIQKRNEEYYITTGNLIDVHKVDALKGQLEHINKLDKDELKKYHKHLLKSGKISEKGGAGLGLIEMARKAGNPLTFDFKSIDDKFSYFYLHTEIPTQKTSGEIRKEDDFDAQKALDNLKSLHNLLNRENILLNFKGTFTQEIVLNLLTIIEDRMEESAITIKVYNIMAEMIQNIVQHGDNINGVGTENPGIFYISMKDSNFVLTAGNRVKNEKINELKHNIDTVNNLDTYELNDYYEKILLDFETDDPENTGLGFVDMRLKSKQKLVYNFHKIDEVYSLFTVQTSI